MKIGIYDPYLDDGGGGEKYMFTMAEFFSNHHEVTIFWDKKEDLDKISKRFSLDLNKVAIKKNIFSSNISFLERVKKSMKYDVLIVLSDGSLPFIVSKKVFIHFQQPFPNITPTIKNSFKKTKVNKFFCNSFFTKNFIDKEFGVNSEVIYPPVDLVTTSSEKENIILHVGRFRVMNDSLEDYKKQKTMVDVFKEMVDAGLKNWSLYIAVGLNEGEELDFQKLKDNAMGYPIHFELNLNKEELNKLYGKAKIYWHASGFGEDLEKNPELAEHFGITTAEAMSAMCVPVVINAGGQKEIVKNMENGLTWDSLEDLKNKTQELINNPNLWKKLSHKAKEDSEKFSKERFCREIADLIQK